MSKQTVGTELAAGYRRFGAGGCWTAGLPLLVGTILSIWSIVSGEPSFVIIYLTLLIVGFMWSWSLAKQEYGGDAYLPGLFNISFALRVAFAIGLHILLIQVWDSPYLPAGPASNPDDIRFDQGAAVVTDAWRHTGLPALSIVGDPHARLYYYLIGTLYYLAEFVGGTTTLGIILAHCFIGALVPVYIYRLANLLIGRREARLASIIAAGFPNFLLYSAVLLRDMLIALLITYVIWQLTAYLLKDQRWWRLAPTALVIGLLLPALREGTVVAMAIIAPLVLIVPSLSRTTRRRQRIILGAITGIFFLSLLVPLLASEWIDIASNRLQWRSPDDQAAILLQRTTDDSLSASLLTLPMIIRLPVQSVYSLLFPFPPWAGFQDELARPQKIVGALSASVWYLLIPLFLIGFVHCVRRDKLRLFPIYGPVLIFFAAFGIETAFDERRRLMAMPLILILVGVGWYNRQRYPIIFRWWMFFLVVTLGLYAVLKTFTGGGFVTFVESLILGSLLVAISMIFVPSSTKDKPTQTEKNWQSLVTDDKKAIKFYEKH